MTLAPPISLAVPIHIPTAFFVLHLDHPVENDRELRTNPRLPRSRSTCQAQLLAH